MSPNFINSQRPLNFNASSSNPSNISNNNVPGGGPNNNNVIQSQSRSGSGISQLRQHLAATSSSTYSPLNIMLGGNGTTQDHVHVYHRFANNMNSSTGVDMDGKFAYGENTGNDKRIQFMNQYENNQNRNNPNRNSRIKNKYKILHKMNNNNKNKIMFPNGTVNEKAESKYNQPSSPVIITGQAFQHSGLEQHDNKEDSQLMQTNEERLLASVGLQSTSTTHEPVIIVDKNKSNRDDPIDTNDELSDNPKDPVRKIKQQIRNYVRFPSTKNFLLNFNYIFLLSCCCYCYPFKFPGNNQNIDTFE